MQYLPEIARLLEIALTLLAITPLGLLLVTVVIVALWEGPI